MSFPKLKYDLNRWRPVYYRIDSFVPVNSKARQVKFRAGCFAGARFSVVHLNVHEFY